MQFTYLDRCIIIGVFVPFAGFATCFPENAGTSTQDAHTPASPPASPGDARKRDSRAPGAAPAWHRTPIPRSEASDIVATVVYVEIGPAWNRNRGGAARKAAVDAARGFDSDILLIANGISSNAKDSAAVAALQVHGGTSAQVLATGPDEEAALQALLPVLQAR
ncbi:HPr family phosphocarrier protein [Burkholderia cepacia]|uniref:HPr family phosphocarrier protein n=1 Tax=Burkholderia cepacia TaxID=292 RepID=UPI001E590F9F|nr:HPr family phosphocarrier protein [Burkholderia cepacia]